MRWTIQSRRLLVMGALALAFQSGCNGCTDTTEQNNGGGDACPAGEVQNPVTGQCQPGRTGGGGGDGDAGCPAGQVYNPVLDQCVPEGDGGGPVDMGQDMRVELPDMPMVMVDVADADQCQEGLDSDGDGLDNACECLLGTDAGLSDTDGDGLNDNFEDANGNCQFDALDGETQATRADTDSDGLDDATELREGLDPLKRDTDEDGIDDGAEYNSCLNPFSQDTDGDGIPDGVEDASQDGTLGECPNRMYEVGCALGEYDPCSADTDGDGIPDDQEVNFLGCRQEFLDQLAAPNTIIDNAADYQLAVAQGITGSAVTGLPAGSAAHAFNDAPNGYAGFVAKLAKPSPNDTPERLRTYALGRVQSAFGGASLENNGRRVITHDNHPARVRVRIALGSSGDAAQRRDQVLAALGNTASVSHGAGAGVGNGNALTLLLAIVDRGGSDFYVVGAVVDGPTYDDPALETGFQVDDIVGAASLAGASDILENDCVAFQVEDRPKVGFIWVIDGSGSMSDENNLVRTYADDFAAILGRRNIDWRLGVVSSNCQQIINDQEVDPFIRQQFQGSGFSAPCPSLPFGGNNVNKNGYLCDKNNANFTDNPQLFKECIQQAASQSIVSEYTVTMGAAAISRALPRSNNDPRKLREGAATVVISVTDEFDDFFQIKMGWDDGGGQGDPPVDPTLDANFDSAGLDTVVQPFVDYFLQPEIAATVFGIIWLPGQACSLASEAAAGIERVADLTGGLSGNICSGAALTATLERIAEASAGLASGLRIRGIPVPQSMVVRVGRVATQDIIVADRSRAEGWDYDSPTNAVAFSGNSRPTTNDRVVIAYKRWLNSVNACVENSDCPTFQKFRCINGECR